ncbi:MAG: hypothetical protein QXS81_05345 [Candidatus Micrarchaeaceae archaeon]
MLIKAYMLMVLSTIFYAINGTVEFLVIKNMQLGATILSIGIGLLIGVVVAGFAFKMRFRLRNARSYSIGAFSALMITGYTILLFLGYERYTLASIYPLIGLSALVFFLVDYARYRKALKSRQVLMLFIGVLFIVFGVFYAESNGYSFQLGTLPFVFGISIMAGIGYYLQFYKISRYSIGSKLVFQPVMLILAALLFISPFGHLQISYPYFGLGLFGGFIFALASAFELRAMKTTRTRGLGKGVIARNFINDFEYADTLLVMLGSILIGSFHAIELLGGVLIVAGIIIIGRLL